MIDDVLEIAQWATLLILSTATVMNARAGLKVAQAQYLLAVDATNHRIETHRLARAVGTEIRQVNARAAASTKRGEK